MKKQLFLTSAMAATLSTLGGCSSNDWDGTVYAENDLGICVDQNGYRVDDDYCETHSRHYHGGSHWYYVGRGSPVPYRGESIHDKRYGFKASPNPEPGKVYGRAPSSMGATRSAAISRGGFGSSSRSFGGGRS